MLSEFFDKVISQLAKNTRDEVRVLNSPSFAPGALHYLKKNDDGVWETSAEFFPLRNPVYSSKTVRSFVKTIELNMSTRTTLIKALVYIGVDKIQAFMGVEDQPWHEAERVELDLSYNDSWKYATSSHSSTATTMKNDIRRLFTGTNVAYPEGVTSIMELIPLLSKVSVKEAKNIKSTTTQTNNSIGIDVAKELVLDDKDSVPEIVRVPVQVYKQIDYLVDVDMLFRYDFEDNKFVLTPIQPSIDTAADRTTEWISAVLSDMDVAKDKRVIFPSAIIVSEGKVTLA